MSDLFVELNRILPNPWQTRQPDDKDSEYIRLLAVDIKARGLLQTPLGRLVDDAGTVRKLPLLVNELMVQWRDNSSLRIQLAFGHNRLAAFQLLANEDPDQYGRMPIRLAELDDQAMALAAWSENAARKDISPLEAAQALQRLSTDFGWTQDQVAEQTGLARSTIANKLRLLRLPEKLLKQLHEGEISERQALSVLPAFELPPAAQAQIERERAGGEYFITRLDEVLAHPDKKTSGDVRSTIRDVVRHVTSPLSTAGQQEYGRAGFPVDRSIDGVDAPACLECENRLQECRCADRPCYDRKQAAFEAGELAFAMAATGLSMISNAELQSKQWNLKKEFQASNQEGLQQALDRHCPNLRLRYDHRDPDRWSLRVPDYPHVAYVCVRGDKETICACADAKEVEREAKERQRLDRKKKEAEKLHDRTVRELVTALRAQDLGAWHAVLYALRVYSYLNNGNADKVAHMDANTTLENIARAVLRTAVDWSSPTHRDTAAELAEWRKKVGWLPADGAEPAVIIETVDDLVDEGELVLAGVDDEEE